MSYEEALDALMFGISKGKADQNSKLEAYKTIMRLIEENKRLKETKNLIKLRADIYKKYGSMENFAFTLGITKAHLSNYLNGKTGISIQLEQQIEDLLFKVELPDKFKKNGIELLTKINELTVQLSELTKEILK